MRPLFLASVVLMAALAAAPAAAQSARAGGTVRDTDGKPVKGAVILAQNPDFVPSEITSTTDDRGRWAMIGLRTGTWRFFVQAPGYLPTRVEVPVRVNASAPLHFALARDPGIPGALDKNIQQQLAAANALRDEGRFDQALAAYHDIRARNPKLTGVNFVIAGVYRTRASRETNAGARQALFEQAIASYTEVLKLDEHNERARAELVATRAEANAGR